MWLLPNTKSLLSPKAPIPVSRMCFRVCEQLVFVVLQRQCEGSACLSVPPAPARMAPDHVTITAPPPPVGIPFSLPTPSVSSKLRPMVGRSNTSSYDSGAAGTCKQVKRLVVHWVRDPQSGPGVWSSPFLGQKAFRSLWPRGYLPPRDVYNLFLIAANSHDDPQPRYLPQSIS